ALARTLDQGACDLLRERSHRHALWLAVLYPLGTWLLVLPFACFLKVYLFGRFSYIVDYLYDPEFSAEWAYWNEMASYLILAGFVMVALFLVVGFSKPAGAPSLLGPTWVGVTPARHWLHARLPVLGSHHYHACLARAARTLSALVAAEAPLHAALREAAHPEIAGPHARDLLQLAEGAERGVPLREGLAATRLPAGLKTLMVNGAEAGALAEALDLAAEWHETRARHLERFLHALLPCVTIPLVGAFVAAFYIPFLWMLFELKTHLPPMR
ncbi:MAG: type II secretion system F family protein, partial [Planctomycetota bacterium]|nr:type II secretion system F family protein [Planctomycetota bacterium]